jgi:hypothetical protein
MIAGPERTSDLMVLLAPYVLTRPVRMCAALMAPIPALAAPDPRVLLGKHCGIGVAAP